MFLDCFGAAPRIAVLRAPFDVDERRLHPEEREFLAARDLSRNRRAEWVAGRLALAALLGRRAAVLTEPDGAPRAAGADEVSISHDGDWLAVAAARAPVGVDLTVRAHGRRLEPVLARLGLARTPLAPAVVWAALECVLKLRRLGVAALVGAAVAVRVVSRRPGPIARWEVEVCGLGAPARALAVALPAFALAVAGGS